MRENLELTIVCEGKVISSNLPEFREAVTMFVGAINRDLATDEQFGQAEIDVKRLKGMEDAIATAKDKALRDAEQLHALFTSLDEISDIPREARLDLSDLIERQKKAVRAKLVADALNVINCFPRLRFKTFGSIVENALKGKRTLDSMRKALDIIVGTLNESLAASKAEIAEWEKANSETVPDAETLELEPAESVRLKLAARTQARVAAEEKKRLEAEAEKERQARMKAEAEAKAAAQAAVVVPAPVAETPAPMATPADPVAVVAPAPIATAPTEDENESEELARLVATIRAAFAPIKAVRQSLKHAANVALATAFADAVLPAYETLSKGGAK